MWPSHRCNEVIGAGEVCALCGQEDPDIWHAFWTCPSFRASEEEAIINTQDLIPDLTLDEVHYYNRLLVTKDMVEIGEQFAPLEHSPVFTTTPHPQGIPDMWPSGYYFGDGSGGIYSSYDFLRRCGVGIHYVSPDLEPGFNAWQPLLGPIQTVPRAELTAVCIVVDKVEVGARIDFFTDSKITKDAFYKGVERARFAANSDLWVQLFDQIQEKHLLVNLHWMPSHTKDDPAKKAKAPEWMKEWHVKANDKADGNADTAAALHVIPRDVAGPPLKVVSKFKANGRKASSNS